MPAVRCGGAGGVGLTGSELSHDSSGGNSNWEGELGTVVSTRRGGAGQW
jgi:hypothetical protein